MTSGNDDLSTEEAHALTKAERTGSLTAQIYRDGVFSEPDFVLLGVLQRLAIRGRLTFRGLGEDRQNAAYTYVLINRGAYAPAELALNAA